MSQRPDDTPPLPAASCSSAEKDACVKIYRAELRDAVSMLFLVNIDDPASVDAFRARMRREEELVRALDGATRSAARLMLKVALATLATLALAQADWFLAAANHLFGLPPK